MATTRRRNALVHPFPTASPPNEAKSAPAVAAGPSNGAAAPGAGVGALTTTPAATTNLVADFLKSPDDLSKIPALRKKLLKEQSSLSAKLKSGAKDQLEATRDGLLKLQATRKDVSTIREAFGEVESICEEGVGTASAADGSNVDGRNAGGNTSGRSFRVISEVCTGGSMVRLRFHWLTDPVLLRRNHVVGLANTS